ncbi:MAG: helix-turn-helix domain-containing protein [Eubacteriaceae bacterium]|nr:helix-turn-helix domain-containing protein [Eubacteriaceae bacterium]
MPTYKYSVQLNNSEINESNQIVSSGVHSARKSTHAGILLKSHAGATVRSVSEELAVSQTTVNAVRKAYSEDGLDRALKRKTRLTDSFVAKIDGEFEAKVIPALRRKAGQDGR